MSARRAIVIGSVLALCAAVIPESTIATIAPNPRIEIILVIDESADMAQEIARLKHSDTHAAIETAVASTGATASIGVVGYGSATSNGAPQVHQRADGTTAWKTALAALPTTPTGVTEPGYDAAIIAAGAAAGPTGVEPQGIGRCILLLASEPHNGTTTTVFQAQNALFPGPTRLALIYTEAVSGTGTRDSYIGLTTLDADGQPLAYLAGDAAIVPAMQEAIAKCVESFPRPDISIHGPKDAAPLGNEEYSTDGVEHTSVAKKKRGKTARFDVIVQHRGGYYNQPVTLSGCEGVRGFKVTYTHEGTDVTPNVTDADYLLPRNFEEPPDTISVAIKVKKTGKRKLACAITTTALNGAVVDAVIAKVVAKG